MENQENKSTLTFGGALFEVVSKENLVNDEPKRKDVQRVINLGVALANEVYLALTSESTSAAQANLIGHSINSIFSTIVLTVNAMKMGEETDIDKLIKQASE